MTNILLQPILAFVFPAILLSEPLDIEKELPQENEKIIETESSENFIEAVKKMNEELLESLENIRFILGDEN